MRRLLITTLALLGMATIGCGQKDKTTIERHYSEDVESPGRYSQDSQGEAADTTPSDGDRRPGNVSVEQRESKPTIVVE